MRRGSSGIFPIFLFSILIWLLPGCSFVSPFPAFKPPKASLPNLYRGVYHVHSKFSHDSKAPLGYLIKTARKAGLDFVVVTDHNTMNGRESYQNMTKPKRPLLIFGDEISTWQDGHLVALGIKTEPPDIGDTQEIVNKIHEQGGFAIPAHPLSRRKPWTNWQIQNFDGIEIFCFSDVFYSQPLLELLPKVIFYPPKLFLKSVLKTLAELSLWDDQLQAGRRTAAFGAADAHMKFRMGSLHVENYLLYFQAVTMYVRADEFKEEKIVEALGRGKSFIAFEVLGLAQNFSFRATAGSKAYGPGEVVTDPAPTRLTIQTSETAEIRLIHNGNVLREARGNILELETPDEGFYRAEAYREGKPWIFSNPIYVRRSAEPTYEHPSLG